MGKFTAATDSSGFPYADHIGSLIYVDVLGIADEITTEYGVVEPVRVNIFVLDGAGKGDEYLDTLIFPKGLRGSLSGKLGKQIIGRFGQKPPTKKGYNPAWAILPPHAGDEKIAEAFEASRGTDSSGDDEPPF